MADKTMYARIKYLTQSASSWTTSNPTLLSGEVGFESDTGKFKIGDGTSTWNSLEYSKVNVINNLTSTSTVDPLSAYQGKVLKDLIDSAGTVTSVATGVGLTGGTITATGTVKANLYSEVSKGTIGVTSKLYDVGVDSNGKLSTLVPWTDTSVTTVANHYNPVTDANYNLDASGATGTSGTSVQVITGIRRDAAGHVTDIVSAQVTDTTYESLPAASSGTAVSLVTTGEKYSWNERVTHDELYATVVSAISYKGTVSTTTELPASGNVIGDVYYVTTPKMLYAWDGVSWQSWGSTTIVDATTTQRGVVKIGNGLTINSGTLSLTTTNLEDLIGSTSANNRLVDFSAETTNEAFDIALASNKTTGAGALGYGNTTNKKLTFNPGTGTLNSYNYTTNFGDLAEDISCNIKPEPGYCYAYNGEKYLKTSSYADEQFIGIHSDTAGYILRNNESPKKIRVALAGFVLAHVDKDYKPGTPLTCGKGGILTEATSTLRSGCPDMIIAKYWKPELAEDWQGIKVNGRHWVKVLK